MNVKKRVIVSACLLGELCRYDGKTKTVNGIIEALSEYEIIPFCPEAPLFGTPREKISVIELDGQNRVVSDETNRDVTDALSNEINSFIKLHPKIDKIILKSKSPSCGYKTTPILNEKREVIKFANGIASEIFEKSFDGVKIEDELTFSTN